MMERLVKFAITMKEDAEKPKMVTVIPFKRRVKMMDESHDIDPDQNPFNKKPTKLYPMDMTDRIENRDRLADILHWDGKHFPKPISDEEAWRIISEYILGKDWCVIESMSPQQANAYMLADIIAVTESYEYRHLPFYEKLKIKLKRFWKLLKS